MSSPILATYKLYIKFSLVASKADWHQIVKWIYDQDTSQLCLSKNHFFLLLVISLFLTDLVLLCGATSCYSSSNIITSEKILQPNVFVLALASIYSLLLN